MIVKIVASKSILLIVTLTASLGLASAQDASLPGAKTAAGIMASSADGLSRYLARDGPIQPALTAIGGLPLRGIEMTNRGISRISESLNSGAQSMSRRAGNEPDQPIRMPGMEAMESRMPESVANLGSKLHGAIQKKNQFIMGQAEKGIQAGERLRNMMQGSMKSVSSRGSKHMSGMADMMSGAQGAMSRGVGELGMQVHQSLEGHAGRLQEVHKIGENLMRHAQGLGETLGQGLEGHMNQLQRTGDQLRNQLQGGIKQNMGVMSNMMDSMHGSMDSMGKNMHKNFDGVVRHAQNAVMHVSSSLQKVASGPIEMVKSIGQNLSQMMPSSGGKGSSSKGKY